MNSNKIKNIINLNADERYNYSIREFVKLEKIWAVSILDSWLTFVDENGDEVFPIWPHKEVAEICIFEEMKVKEYVIESIDYEKFKKFCIPDMNNDKILFGVFYNDKRQGNIIEGDSLLEDLEMEERGDF